MNSWLYWSTHKTGIHKICNPFDTTLSSPLNKYRVSSSLWKQMFVQTFRYSFFHLLAHQPSSKFNQIELIFCNNPATSFHLKILALNCIYLIFKSTIWRANGGKYFLLHIWGYEGDELPKYWEWNESAVVYCNSGTIGGVWRCAAFVLYYYSDKEKLR